MDVPTWRQRAVHFGQILNGDLPSLGPARQFDVVYVGHTAVASGGELALVRLLPGLRHVSAHVILGEDGPIADRLREAGATVEVMPIGDDARAVKRGAVNLDSPKTTLE